MASTYPTTLDSLATNKTDATVSSTDHPQHHDDLADAVNKIEAELGVLPKGSFADVATRLGSFGSSSGFKNSCRAVSTSNIAGTYATGPPATKAVGGTTLTVDSIAIANTDRILLAGQTTVLENGIYVASGIGSSVVLTRASDADNSSEMLDGMLVPIGQGAQSVGANTIWQLNSDDPVTLGTTSLYFSRIYPPPPPPQTYKSPLAPTGAIYEPVGRMLVGSNVTPVSGTIRLGMPVVLLAGIPCTSISFFAGTGATTPTNQWFVIVRQSDRQVLAVTSDDTTTAWGNAVKTLTIASGPYIPPVDTAVWVGVMVVASVMPVLVGTSAGGSLASIAPVLAGNSSTGQTTPITVGATATAPGSSQGATVYFYIS